MQRFRELIVYVSLKCKDDPTFGAIKLNKILYYSDFKAFEKFGTPLTGVQYFRLRNGPAPWAMLHARRELLSEGAINLVKEPAWHYQQHRIVALRSPVMSYFHEDEIILVDSVITELWGQSATKVSDASHDVRWRVLNNKDLLPYEFAFLEDGFNDNDRKRTEELANELGWLQAGP